ncbi:PEGA domain-containing protein [Patescibacteria group bacterium]|nr:PEGA domain-containing protein [Patescibacteria group bacterium]
MKKLLTKFTFFIIVLAVFALAVYRLFSSASSPSKAGSLEVSSFPSNLSVFLDGIWQGETPWVNNDLVPGFYSLKVEDENYSSWEGKVKVSERGLTQVERSLGEGDFGWGWVASWHTARQDQERLAVTSVPSGARVFLDGEEEGQTPLVIDLIRNDIYLFELRLDGYQVFSLELNCETDKGLILDADLALDPLWQSTELKNVVLPEVSQALSEGDIEQRSVWELTSAGCQERNCSTSAWKNLKLYQVEMEKSKVMVSDWLRGLQGYSEQVLQLSDIPFAYLIDASGKVYQGVDKKDVDFSAWDFSWLDSGAFEVKAGDYPVVVFLSAGEKMGDGVKESVARLRQLVSPVAAKKVMVTIGQTPTGFLNVRSGPSLNASIIGKVYPGSSYEFLEERTGWYKIRIDNQVQGWVYAQYAEKS